MDDKAHLAMLVQSPDDAAKIPRIAWTALASCSNEAMKITRSSTYKNTRYRMTLGRRGVNNWASSACLKRAFKTYMAKTRCNPLAWQMRPPGVTLSKILVLAEEKMMGIQSIKC
jgi:hypothetical protein